MDIATMGRLYGRCAILLIAALAALLSFEALAQREKPLRLLVIDDASDAAAARRERMRARFAQLLDLPFGIETIVVPRLDSLDAIGEALQPIPDSSDSFILAGSGLMAWAALRKFHRATVLLASQHDPKEAGVIPRTTDTNPPLTGFTYDVNVVPQIVSVLRRSGVSVKTVGIVADQYLAQAWRRRADEMNLKYREVHFSVFEVDDDDTLERWLRGPEFDRVDVWILLGIAMIDRHFARIQRELEARHRVAVYPDASYVHAGGLMSYEPAIPDPYGVWARQIRLLAHGVPASQVPLERPSVFKLTINLDAARRVGMGWSPGVIKAASEVVSGVKPPAVHRP